MTTLTTRAPLPRLPLSLVGSGSMTCNDHPDSMHPDSILIQNHGVTSPRLSSANSVRSEGDGSPGVIGPTKNCSPPPSLATSNSQDRSDLRSSTPLSPKFVGQQTHLIDIGVGGLNGNTPGCVSGGDNDSERVANTATLFGKLNSDRFANMSSDQSEAYSNNLDDDEDAGDRMSCCSDDSELSVGQECCDNNNSEPNSVTKINHNNGSINNNNNNNNNSTSSNSRQLRNVSNKQVMMDDCESVDNCSSLSDDNRLASVGDDVSNDSSPNRDIEPLLMASAMRVPPVIRPSPTRLQEEFLRKSHQYAEELMKQQMQFVAAARASAFSMRHGGTLSPDIAKVGFRPHIKQVLQQTPELGENLVNFSGIHSHLSAISKISSQLTCGESALSRLTGLGISTSREPSHSPPSSLNPLHPQHLAHLPHHHHHFINNNLNEPSLKFSIDNILKADFGRRITDPILKRSSGGGASGSGGRSGNSRKNSNRGAERNSEKHNNHHGAPIDLTNVVSSQQPGHLGNSSGSSGSSAIAALEKHSRLAAEKSPNITAIVSASVSTAPSASAISSSASSSSRCANASPPAAATSASASSTTTSSGDSHSSSSSGGPMVWPAWVYCTRYSDRPSSGRSPRTRKPKKPPSEKGGSSSDEKRPRTAFSGPQLARLKHEFSENRYLTERRRQQLSGELGLNEAQIKIWFQNKRAKIKKASGTKNPLALQLMAQGLYNHSTVPLTREEEELQELQAKGAA